MAGKKGGASMASPKEKIVQEEESRMTEVAIKARIEIGRASCRERV